MKEATATLNTIATDEVGATVHLLATCQQTDMRHAAQPITRPTVAKTWAGLVGNLALLCVVFAGGIVVSPARAQADPNLLQSWGLETYNEIESTLRVPGTRLFAETAWLDGSQSGGFNGRAYVWPVSTQFRVYNTLTQIDPAMYAGTLRLFVNYFHNAYWDDGYRSGAGGGTRFYDDNAHLVVAYVEAYRLTGTYVYLTHAIDTQAFVMQGEDSVAGGGIYFSETDFGAKDAISTLQGARGAAMLYNATGEQQYLDDAIRLLTWAESHIQNSAGFYHQRWSIAADSADGVELVNAAGVAISLNIELYDATGLRLYLREAQRIANASANRYIDATTGHINDEGYWAYELVDALANLYRHDGNRLWLNKIYNGLVWLHDNKRDPNGHYGVFWGREGVQVGALSSWRLNDQASVARAYLYTSVVATPPPDPPDWSQVITGDTQVMLTWNASDGADAYNLYRSSQSGGGYELIASELTETSYTDDDVVNGAPYFYVVTAGNYASFSNYSDEVSAIPCVNVAADLDGDCDVDFDDFSTFSGCFAGPDLSPTLGCEDSDLDGDNDVDLSDFRILQQYFNGQNTVTATTSTD